MFYLITAANILRTEPNYRFFTLFIFVKQPVYQYSAGPQGIAMGKPATVMVHGFPHHTPFRRVIADTINLITPVYIMTGFSAYVYSCPYYNEKNSFTQGESTNNIFPIAIILFLCTPKGCLLYFYRFH